MTDQTQKAAMEREALIDAMRDMLNGWKYIRSSHGDLYGVGWDRAQNKMEAALAVVESTPAAPAVGAPVATGVLPLPKHYAVVGRFDDENTPVYTGDQMHEYAARCMLHAIPALAASLREQEDAKDAARWREVIKSGIPYSKDFNLTDEQIAASVDERIAQRLGCEKEQDHG